jgi:hypothetical protein
MAASHLLGRSVSPIAIEHLNCSLIDCHIPFLPPKSEEFSAHYVLLRLQHYFRVVASFNTPSNGVRVFAGQTYDIRLHLFQDLEVVLTINVCPVKNCTKNVRCWNTLPTKIQDFCLP